MPVLARTRLGLATARATMPRPVVLVPTMGALHDGHRSLLRLARELAGHPPAGTPAAPGAGGSVLVSVFVNPLQFGGGEDFGHYPRTMERDLEICAEEGAGVVFAPAGPEMYPADPQVTVDPGSTARLMRKRAFGTSTSCETGGFDANAAPGLTSNPNTSL